AHVGDGLEVAGRGPEPVDDDRAAGGGVLLQVVGEHVVEGGVAGGGGDRVAAEGRDAVAADAVEEVAAANDAADREAVAEALGERHEVGGDAVGLDAPEGLAGAAPAG